MRTLKIILKALTLMLGLAFLLMVAAGESGI